MAEENGSPVFHAARVYSVVPSSGVLGAEVIKETLRGELDSGVVDRCLSLLLEAGFLWSPLPHIYGRLVD